MQQSAETAENPAKWEGVIATLTGKAEAYDREIKDLRTSARACFSMPN